VLAEDGDTVAICSSSASGTGMAKDAGIGGASA
jgi:hypothetical protein